LADVETGDEVVVVVDVAFRRGVPSVGDLAEVFFQVGDDVLEAGDLGGVLRGTGLDSKREAMDKLAECWADTSGCASRAASTERGDNGVTSGIEAPAGEDGSEMEGERQGTLWTG